jgi:hypothetical protein
MLYHKIMKRVILLLFFGCFSCLFSFAQGNLQFNQVLTISSTDQTVPAGKVWKLESYQQQSVGISTSSPITSCGDLSRVRPYYIDGLAYNDIKGTGSGLSNVLYIPQNTFPIWLKAGQTCRTTCVGDFLSVLEFNIVP